MPIELDNTVIDLDNLGKKNENDERKFKFIFLDFFPQNIGSPLSDDPNDDFNRFSSALFDEQVRRKSNSFFLYIDLFY